MLHPPAPDHPQGPSYARIERILRWPMTGLAVLFVCALVAEHAPGTPPPLRRILGPMDWAIWGAFALEYVLMLLVARNRRLYVRTHVLEALTVLLPALRVVRGLRAVRLARLVRSGSAVAASFRGLAQLRLMADRRGVTATLCIAAAVLAAGAYLAWTAEAGANPGFATYGDALWWAIVTATTVGYGDVLPVTTLGRVVAATFMLTGVAVFGAVAALIAAFFVEHEREDEDKELLSHVGRLTAAIEALEARIGDLEEALGRPREPD